MFPREGNPEKAIPLLEVDWGRGVDWLDLDDARLDLWGRAEVVLADLHDVGDLRQQLGVDGEAAVELVTRLGDETKGELALEHEKRGPEDGPVEEQLEHNRRGDLVRQVGDADIKVGQLGLEDISNNNLEPVHLRTTKEKGGKKTPLAHKDTSRCSRNSSRSRSRSRSRSGG